MWTEIARIIHVTDMHLFVDAQGNLRPFQERAVSILLAASVPGIGKGVHHHSRRALNALLNTLETITAPPAGKLLLIQSGDLETYGAKRQAGTSSAGWSFPGFDYWEQETRRRLPQVDMFIDLYGNHDVWPGAHPLSPFARLNINEAERSLRTTRQTFDLPMPHHDTVIDVSPYRLEVYRLNTVQTGLLASTLAHGKIDSDVWLTYKGYGVYPFSNHDNPITEIIALAQQATISNLHQQAIRLLIMHHPPHFFNATGSLSDLTKGPLVNANDILQALQTTRFHFVLAGHRHAINPSLGTTLRPGSGGQPQPPLPDDTIQLVASSATQHVDPGDERQSFCLYQLYADAAQNKLRLDRLVYRFENDRDTLFTPVRAGTEMLVDGLSIS